MERFLRCLCEHDLTALVIIGNKAPEKDLKEAWIILLNEYHELRDDPVNRDKWELQRDVTYYRSNLELTQTCIDFLNRQYSDVTAQSLRRLGYSFFKPVSTNPEDYRELLERVAERAKTKYIHLQQMLVLMDKQNEELAQAHSPSRQYFEDLLGYIEQMQGTTYNFDDISVSRFVTLEKKYYAYLDAIEQKKAQAANK